ncbi:MAG: aminotransferase class I/II-fold pyridoxal phosphate-dependent enzyme, partial [Clostridiales bacterium]|nr:aminotransferase class I/II-fold pyridoxal phosphate-dependent enzyme [Clostridiales bacterium]
MTDFSTVYNRRNTGNIKWGNTPEDTMAMSVAEMEYALPDNVTKRLSERTAWPFYGYDRVPEGLESSIVNHYRERFGVILEPEWVVIITSVMPGLNMACRMAKGKILYNIPMYSHIRVLSQETKIEAIEVPMLVDKDNRYHMNFEEMEKQVTPEVSTFILCNPHNPVGRSYTKEEIEMVAQFCGKHDLLLLSDEIHCELTFDNIHNPCFSISETSREISITFNSAGKILNIPGIPGAIAIIPNKELRERFTEYTAGVFSQPNAFAMEAL